MIFILLAAFFFLVAGVLAFIATVWAISIAVRKGRVRFVDSTIVEKMANPVPGEIAGYRTAALPDGFFDKIREGLAPKPPGYSYVDKILESDLIGDE